MAKHKVPGYLHLDGQLVHTYQLDTGNMLRFSAGGIRREKTGTHATVTISLNYVSLAYSLFNIDRDEERTRLANSAFPHLGEVDAKEFGKTDIKHSLDQFCFGLWSETVISDMGYMMAGDDTKQPVQLVRGALVQGGGTLLFGPPGRGKTTTALVMAVCLDAGIETLWGLPGGARRCLYVNLERSKDSLAYRLARTNRALGLPSERPLVFINARGRSLTDVFEAIQRTIRQYDIEVVFLDSISRMGGGSLVDDEAVNRVMDRLNELPTWLALAHTPRADATHAYGSQMFDAAADIAIQMRAQSSADGRTSGVAMQVTKRNDIPQPPVKVIAYEWTLAGLAGVRIAEPFEFPEAEAGQDADKVTVIRELLLLRGAMTATQVSTATGIGRTTCSSILANHEQFKPADSKVLNINRSTNSVFYEIRY